MKKGKASKLALALIIVLMTTMLAGCGSDKGKNAKEKDELVVATAYDAKSLDPHAVNEVAASNVMLQIYNTLVTIDDEGNVTPSLAESYEHPDDLTYEFKLKKGVKFHNGDEMKASDVKFSLERAANSPAIAHIFGDINTDSFETPDDYTISFKLNNPNTGFLAGLAHIGGSVLSEKAVTELGDRYGMEPVGTGPFKFLNWAKGDRIELERFDDYFDEPAKFKKMVLRVIPEPTNRAIELESGGVDVAYEIATNDISRIEDNENLQITRKIDNSVQYLGFNNQKEPFNDVKVRQAISYALDTNAIVNTVWRGVGQVAKGPMAPNVKYFDDTIEVHEYNVEKAKELLKEAGYADGFKVTLSTNEKQERVDMATIIKSQLKEVGIDVTIEILEWGAYLEKLGNGEQEMFIIGWTSQTPDPDMALYGPLSKETLGAGANFSFFEDDEVNDLLLEGRRIGDSPKREEVYKKIQNRVVELSPWVFLFNGEAVVGSAKYVKGLEVTPFGYHPLYKIYFENN